MALYKALTVNINPKTFVTINGKRRRWENHCSEEQTNFLDVILGKMDRHHMRYTYGYEKTIAMNVHLHVAVYCKDEEDLEYLMDIRDEFLKLLPKQTKEYQARCWYIESMFDRPGWDKYVLKEQQHKKPVELDDELSEGIQPPVYKLFSNTDYNGNSNIQVQEECV
jgi:hypothetical protein